jgi:hypothetical protein
MELLWALCAELHHTCACKRLLEASIEMRHKNVTERFLSYDFYVFILPFLQTCLIEHCYRPICYNVRFMWVRPLTK